MKLIVRGILQKLMKYWTIRQRDDRPSDPATQHIILKIDGFQMKQQSARQQIVRVRRYVLPNRIQFGWTRTNE